MRKEKRFLSALVALCLLLTVSCRVDPDLAPVSSYGEASSQVSGPDNTPLPTEEPTETEPPSLWPDKKQEGPQAEISSSFEALDEGLYRVEDLTEATFFQVGMEGSTLLVTHMLYPEDGPTDCRLQVSTVNVQTGKRSAECQFSADDGADTRLLSEDRVAVVYGNPLTFEIYDGQMELLYRYCSDIEPCRYQTYSISPDGTKLVYALSDTQEIEVVDLETGERLARVAMEDPVEQCLFRDGELWLVTAEGEGTSLFTLTPTLWEPQPVGRADGYLCAEGLFSLESGGQDLAISPLTDPSLLALFPEQGDCEILDYKNGTLLLLSYPEDSDGLLLSAVDIHRKTRYTHLCASSELYPIAAIGDNGLVAYVSDTGLFLWQYEDDEGGELAFTVTTREALEQETQAYEKELKERYPITVFSGSQGNDFLSDEYVAQVSDDPVALHAAMTILRETLALYPEGMLREMCTGEIRQIHVYLSGPIYAITQQGIDTAVGLTYTLDDTRVIVADVSYGLEELAPTLVHELMHIADDKLLSMEEETGIPYLSSWDSFLPPGMDGYYGAYEDEYGRAYSNRRYTRFNETDDRVYFIDAYSKTFATEDRARIMEYLMRGYWMEDDTLVYGEHLLEKARFLCVLLRECFESVEDEDVLPWEVYLDIDPEEFRPLLTLQEQELAS